MSVATGAKIATDGLCFYFDAANVKSAKSQKSNILSWNDWKSGTSDNITSTGSWPSYWRNGEVGINTRILDTNPFGVTDVIWDVSNQDAASDDDGGWQTSEFTIDTTKTYRFSTWVRRKTIGNGSFYLGPHSNWGAIPGAYILNRSNGAENQNPYFIAQNWWGNANDWYLVVGHVWAAGSGTGSSHPDSGIYTTAGVKLSSATDYMWAPTNTTSFHRTYLYYSTDITTNQQWYQPRVDICDGNQPTIVELLNNVGNKIYDLSGNNLNTSLVNGVSYTSTNMGSFGFNGSTTYMTVADSSILTSTSALTIDIWVYGSDIATRLNELVGKGSSDADEEYCIIAGNGSIYFDVGGIAGPYTQPSFSFSNNVWYNITCVHSRTAGSSTLTVYVNGSALSGTTTNPTSAVNDNSLPVSIGRRFYNSDPNSRTFNGRFGQLRMYNTALSSSQILSNFNAMRGRYGV